MTDHTSRQRRLLVAQVQPREALALAGAAPMTPAAEELIKTSRALEVVLEPVYRGTDDPDLAQFFEIDVPEEDAEGIAEALKGCGAVIAAYIKPPGEPA